MGHPKLLFTKTAALVAAFACSCPALPQDFTLHCQGRVTTIEMKSGASESEDFLETFVFDRGRRDGLIPYNWSPERVGFQSKARFQHEGIIYEGYTVEINRLNGAFSKIERMRVRPPGFKTTHDIEKRYQGKCVQQRNDNSTSQ